LTLSRISTTKTLLWLLSEQYLNRRYRADSFAHFSTPVVAFAAEIVDVAVSVRNFWHAVLLH